MNFLAGYNFGFFFSIYEIILLNLIIALVIEHSFQPFVKINEHPTIREFRVEKLLRLLWLTSLMKTLKTLRALIRIFRIEIETASHYLIFEYSNHRYILCSKCTSVSCLRLIINDKYGRVNRLKCLYK